MSLLLSLFLLPCVTALFAFFFVRSKQIAFVLSLLPLLFLLYSGSSLLGQSIDYSWIPTLFVRFHLAVDPLALLFLYLANVIIPLAIIADRKIELQPTLFYGLILSLQALSIGFFTSKDLVCFTFFFEALLLPLYFLITGWGGAKKEKAAFTFIIYMIAGSVLLVAALFSLFLAAGTFDLDALAKVAEHVPFAPIIAAVFLLAFFVKTPLFPFHAWLPDAYVEAPLAGTILLSALLSKAGIFGILRVVLPLFPSSIIAWSPYLIVFAIAGVLYGAFAAWGETNFKRLIAYSSFSHVNFILAGLFVWNEMAHSGAILQALNHSITIAALFLVASWLEIRLGSAYFGNVSGLATYLPCLCWLTLFFTLSAVALPGLNTFVSEVMLLFGVFQESIYLAFFLGLTVIFSVVYMLRWIHSVYFREPSEYRASFVDLKLKESVIALPLVLLILWLGLYPGPVLQLVMPTFKNEKLS